MKKIKHINEQKNRCDYCYNKFIYTSKCVKCDKTTCGALARQGGRNIFVFKMSK